jgi:glycosyltransferase involved in cell wall biosynthesis
MIQQPLITIITVVYNGENDLESTILSVLNQDFKNYEFIIIDGNSTDNTISIIKKYSEKVDIIISENDLGIYDAMNKGILNSNGKWIFFLNCGDLFYDKFILSKVALELENNIIDFLYGDCILKSNFTKGKILKAKKFSYINYGMPFCHQSVFVGSNILKNNLFDTEYKLVADYNFFYKLFREHNYKYRKVRLVISIYDIDGVSNSINSFIEMYRIIRNYNSPFSFIVIFHRVRLSKFHYSGRIKHFLKELFSDPF